MGKQLTQITLRKALVLLVALPMLVAGVTAGTVYASEPGGGAGATDGTRVTKESTSVGIQDAGKANGTVSGVPFCSSLNANQGDCWTWENNVFVACPSGHFCIYFCKEYSLSNWNDRGWVWNNNDNNAPGYLKNVNHATISGGTIAAQTSKNVDFNPIWYVRAC